MSTTRAPWGLSRRRSKSFAFFGPMPAKAPAGANSGSSNEGRITRPLAAPDRPGKTDEVSSWLDEETRAWKMDHDLADPLVDAADGDVLRREGNDLSANFDFAIVVGRDPHPVADLPLIGIVRVALVHGFGA